MDVVVVTGVGGMGVACARRLGGGVHLVLADFDDAKLERGGRRSSPADGFTVTGQRVDVSDRASVDALVARVRDLGTAAHARAHRRALPHAGVGRRACSRSTCSAPTTCSTRSSTSSCDGTAAVCIASMAGYMASLTPAQEAALTAADTDGLMAALGDVDARRLRRDLQRRQAGQPAAGREGRGGVGRAAVDA